MDLENRAVGAKGEPTLGAAYEIARDEWRAGDRDRELALHLLFLAWYLLVEPPHLTGLNQTRISTRELSQTFRDVHAKLAARDIDSDDTEVLHVVGLMARLAPYVLGAEEEWTATSRRYRERCRELAPSGINAEIFARRGAYGEYFRRQLLVKDEH